MLYRTLIIAIVVGETSGDNLAASLIKTIRNYYPNVKFVGIAGPLMRLLDCEAWYYMEDMTTLGLMEVISKIPYLLRIRYILLKRLIKLKPDVFIGIDMPDFNLSLEKNLKDNGIRTVHYVSPSIWAWRYNRIFKIASSTDLVLLLFPFEKKIYDAFNIPCCFVGHFLADLIPLQPDKLNARRKLNINDNSICLAILPGSRDSELNSLSIIFLETAKLLCGKINNVEILIPLVNKNHCYKLMQIKLRMYPNLKIRIIEGNSHQVMIASDIAIVASGTATLECMLSKCPMVVCYRLNLITYWLLKYLVDISWISLPNILANREVVKEFVQDKCQPEKIVSDLEEILMSRARRDDIINTFMILHREIRCNANDRAARAILKLCKVKPVAY